MRLPARTVLVHDYLNQYGGAERVLEVFHALADDPPVYTSIYAPDRMPDWYQTWNIRTTWLNRLPGVDHHHQRALPLYPLAFRRMKLPACDLVLSSSSAFAKMVKPPLGAVHICYTHAPMRFAWNLDHYLAREPVSPAQRTALRPLMTAMRRADQSTTAGVDRFIANSTAVRNRIRAYWRRDATVIYPPVETERFKPVAAHEIGDFFLMVSRLVPYKRFDLAIHACNTLKLPLWIVGEGRDRAALESIAGPTVRFLGSVSDRELEGLFARCRAAVFAAEDDFGIAQVEAQAAGRPVISFAAGGALDTVVPDRTGVLVPKQSIQAFIEGFQRFERISFDVGTIVEHASRFSRERFERELLGLVDETLQAHRNGEGRRWN